jgi:DNA-binding transcriptional LysR family regulator
MIQPPRLYIILDTVARTGSIRKAAEKLRIASTALNRRILEFEKEIGTPLFERLPRGVRLTAAGEILVATIRRSLSDLTSAGSQIEQLRGLVRGMVRIACAESAANDLIPETIARYQERYPGVQFQMLVGSTAPLMAALLEDEADLMLAHDPPSSDQLNIIVSVRQPLCAMMRLGHPLAGRDTLRLADCQPYPVALGAETFGSRKLINALLAKSRLSLRVAMESSAVQPQKVFARDTDAICFQYQIGTLRDVRYGELVAIPLTDPALMTGVLVLASRAGRILPIPAASFVETLKAAFAAIPVASMPTTGAARPRSK